MSCIKCGSMAINHHIHGRDGTRPDLCDVCFWIDKYESMKCCGNCEHYKPCNCDYDSCVLTDKFVSGDCKCDEWEMRK
jgi:hypothetical protein